MTKAAVSGELLARVVAIAKGQCQCTGACGKKHAGPDRKPGRCETTEHGRTHLLALPRNPLLAWHVAAGLPAERLIAFCPDCAGGVRRKLNRAIKAQPPQGDALFEIEQPASAVGNPT